MSQQPIDVTTLFNQPDFSPETIRSLVPVAFGSIHAYERFRDLTEECERGARADGAAVREVALKLGLSFWLLGRPERALEWLGQSQPGMARHFFAGLCQRELRAYEASLAEFERAAAAGWDEVETQCERAETLLASGNVAGARQIVDGLRDRARSVATWHYLAGRLKERDGDPAGAMAAYDAALALDGAHARALFQLAYLCDLYGSDDEAVDLYRRCAKVLPVHVNALVNLAVLLEDRGLNDEAEQCLRRVLAVHPNHPRAKLFLKDVQAAASQVIDEDWERASEMRSAMLDTPLNEFELSVRARNCLKRLNINSLGDLLRVSEADLLAYKNFGDTSLAEIKALLAEKGLKLGQNAGSPGARPAPRKVVVQGNPEVLNKPVSELELSVRSRKCLQRLGIVTVGELASRTEPELMQIRNFGQTSLNEIKRRLAEIGLSLRSVGD